jgi:ABC-2 type transport system ATP-binding protein
VVEHALSAEHFGRRYRRRAPWAVRDVSLQIGRGSITALVGPNGAGKSTLIRSWMGFERPNEGRVFVEGIDVVRRRDRAVERVGYVPQASALYRDLSVADHFSMATSYRPVFDRESARQRVNHAGVAVYRRVGELSGGEQAQVALALALSTRAPVLLLDEPLASLDPLARREFLAVLVDEVRSGGRTAMLSSHIVTDVQQACDQLIILSHGRLLLHASVAEARRDHRTVVGSAGDEGLVGRFLGPAGEVLALVQSSDPTLPEASLEEIVLGYLASQRPTA